MLNDLPSSVHQIIIPVSKTSKYNTSVNAKPLEKG